MNEYSAEDVGNIIALEHINVQVPDQLLATLFYIVGMGFTRDPYLNVGLTNMWANAGEQQFHLPTRQAQVINGFIGIVVPDLEALATRLRGVEEGLRGTEFHWSENADTISVTCPWGNRFRCHEAGPEFGDMKMGIPYVEFLTAEGSADSIASFYRNVMKGPAAVELNGGKTARVSIGRNQSLLFRESRETPAPYDGHHIAVYVANFSHPYGELKRRGLITEDVRNHQFRFKDIIDPETGSPAFFLEHEVRSLRHPMFHRFFVNRDAAQTQRQYRRGRDALIPFAG
ncbi:MAG TPA: hypothetical protein VIB79_26315 [Candidatus Binatia bacterium]|jgi:hypothetical protein